MPNYAGTVNMNARKNTSFKVPIGAVISTLSTATAPAGWLYCDGSAVSRTTYAQLFSILSTTYGAGDGSTTFNLPDYRGRFLRGINSMGTAAGNNSKNPDNNVLGGAQADAHQGHWHNVYGAQWYYATSGTISSYHGIYGTGTSIGLDTTGRAKGKNVQSDGSSGNAKTSNETRPMNVAALLMIRAL